jgi:hypothetical protein
MTHLQPILLFKDLSARQRNAPGVAQSCERAAVAQSPSTEVPIESPARKNPSSISQTRLMSSLLPAKEDKHWYGELL